MKINKIIAFLNGLRAEQLACSYLKKQGLKVITKNYHCRMGEIDLIMRHEQYLVFIEVRYRHNTKYGTASESVTLQKQKKIIKTAQYYLLKNGLTDKVPCRFDIIDISTSFHITWIKDAFSYESIR
ncbi:MAG: hypothetical protein LEGION0398_MBIBDBAK_00856 [Legionellaceae bacterium]